MKEKLFKAVIMTEIGIVLTVFGIYTYLLGYSAGKGIGIIISGIIVLVSMLTVTLLSDNKLTIEMSAEVIRIFLFAFQSVIVFIAGIYMMMCNMSIMGRIVIIAGALLMLYLIPMCKNIKVNNQK